MKNNELLKQLLIEKGYDDYANAPLSFEKIADIEYQFFLFTLQNWLRNTHQIHVFILPGVQTTDKMEFYFGNIWYFDKHWIVIRLDSTQGYIKILEALLINALQLIK
jgi:hypothetical protein